MEENGVEGMVWRKSTGQVEIILTTIVTMLRSNRTAKPIVRPKGDKNIPRAPGE